MVEGTTFREVLERARQRRADAMLAEGIPFAGVADALGFSGVHSFRRAYQRWQDAETGSAAADASACTFRDAIGRMCRCQTSPPRSILRPSGRMTSGAWTGTGAAETRGRSRPGVTPADADRTCAGPAPRRNAGTGSASG